MKVSKMLFAIRTSSPVTQIWTFEQKTKSKSWSSFSKNKNVNKKMKLSAPKSCPIFARFDYFIICFRFGDNFLGRKKSHFFSLKFSDFKVGECDTRSDLRKLLQELFSTLICFLCKARCPIIDFFENSIFQKLKIKKVFFDLTVLGCLSAGWPFITSTDFLGVSMAIFRGPAWTFRTRCEPNFFVTNGLNPVSRNCPSNWDRSCRKLIHKNKQK